MKLGSIVWILSLQYYIVQFFTARAWASHFSLAGNTISDLGNTACGLYGKMYVCSPDHAWMNLSFILIGLGQASGAVFIYQNTAKKRLKALGFGCLFLAGIGSILVGFFPENGVAAAHIAGAGLSFLFGNIGLILLGLSLKIPRFLKIYTLASGYIALSALILFVSRIHLGLGAGGMERLSAYPQTIWLIIFGVYLLRSSNSGK